MGCMLTADGSGDDELCIQGLEEVQFSFELSDRHRNAKTGEMQEAASTDSDDSEDNSDDDMEREVVTVEPGAADASDTDEGSTSDEEAPLVSFKAPDGISFYDALPPDIEEDFSRAFGCKIAHTFTTGWEIGVLKGIEKRKKEHKGEYIVKYPSEQKPYWHNLSKGEYGADKYGGIANKVGPPCVNVDTRGGVGVQESASPLFFWGGGRVSKIPSL